MLQLFAHGDEYHTESTSELEHLLTQPLLALPIFILLLIVIYYTLTWLKVSQSTIVLIEFAVLLFTGLLTFSLIPAVSIFAISAGILGALLMTLTQLAK